MPILSLTMRSPYPARAYLGRSAEHPIVLVATAIIIALAIWKPRGWIFWIAGTIIAAIVLAIVENEANRRRDRW